MKNSKTVFFGGLLLIFVLALSAFADYFAVGDYVQDAVITENSSDLYNADKGFHFDGMKTYEKGDFSSYSWSGGNVIRTEAGLLTEGSYENMHSLLCTSNISSLVNPMHSMYEEISINSSMISYYEPGAPSNCSDTLRMVVPKRAVSYTVYTDYIPMKRITKDSGETGCVGPDCYLDFEYRGKMLFLGEEYYVRDIDGNDKIYLAKGQMLNVSDSGYTAQYKGYKFKIDHLITSSPYYCDSMLLDVQKPDGTIVQVLVSGFGNRLVDDLEITGLSFQIGATQTGSIIDPAAGRRGPGDGRKVLDRLGDIL
jgi:hypothetical protein